jgi:hypothetical protein
VLECYVVPTMAVTDYRTSTTGITPAHLSSGKSTKLAGPLSVPPMGLFDFETDSAELVY